MVKNNARILFWHVLWYALVSSFFFSTNVRAAFNLIVRDKTLQYGLLAGLTIIFTALVCILFIEPTGRISKDISSNITLMILDVIFLALVALTYVIGKISMYHAGIFGFTVLIHWFVLVFVLGVKYERSL